MTKFLIKIKLKEEERLELEQRIRSVNKSKRDRLRAQIILLRSEGKSQHEVAKKTGVSHACVSKWTRRFIENGIEGLKDFPGRGRKPSIPPEKIEQVITRVAHPPPGRKRWSVRTMAKAVGISRHSVHQIWKKNNIKPHLVKTFNIPKSPAFEKKFWDVIGLYLDPPDKALILCCDEKGQYQALKRTQPDLPFCIGHIQTKTHDYIRHGTITLFAALNYLDRKIISRTEKRHAHVEWLRFFKQLDREIPKELNLYLIVDNYSTYKHKKVRQWIDKHPRFHIHYIPAGTSWLNIIERFFSDLTNDVIKDGSFTILKQLVRDIEVYLADINFDSKCYRWRVDREEILRKIQKS